jgi:hypothetical protein
VASDFASTFTTLQNITHGIIHIVLQNKATIKATIYHTGITSIFRLSFSVFLFKTYKSISLNNVINANTKIIIHITYHHSKENISKSSTTICPIIQRIIKQRMIKILCSYFFRKSHILLLILIQKLNLNFLYKKFKNLQNLSIGNIVSLEKKFDIFSFQFFLLDNSSKYELNN